MLNYSFLKKLIGLLLMMSLLSISVFSKEIEDISNLDLESLLDNIVFSASKHAETLEEAPANVFIITREMIDNYGCQNIGEALSMAPGIYVTDDYTLSQIGVRGISNFGDWNMHVMVLVDGRPINEQYGGTSSIDVPGVDIDNIERIEVIKGPASSLYGSNAFFGIVNLITNKPTENSVALTSKYYSGTDIKSSSLNFFHRINNELSIHSTATYIDQNGSDIFFEEFSDLSDFSLLSQDADGMYQFYLDTSEFTYGIAHNTNLMENFSTHNRIDWKNYYMTLHYSSLNTGVPFSMWGSLFNKKENRFKERNHFVDIGYSSDYDGNLNFSTRLFYQYYTWSDHVLYNYSIWEADPAYLPGPIWMNFEKDESYGAEIKINIKSSEKNNLILGGEVQFHNILHESGETDASGDIIQDNIITPEYIHNDGQIYNIYLQNEYQFSEKIKFVGGLHYNYYSYTTGKITPKGALIAQPYKNGTWKFIASKGFRSPTFYEMTYDDGQYYIRNIDLVPELITSYEMIVSHKLPYGLYFEVAGNYSKLKNLIVQSVIDISDPSHPGGSYLDGVSQFQNMGVMNYQSIEFAVKGNPIYRLSGFANISYQDHSHDELIHGAQANSPRWLGNFGLTYQIIPQKLSVSGRMNHISSRLLWDESTLEKNSLFDLIVNSKKLFGYLDVSLSVKNVFDKKYSVPLSFDYAPSTSIARPGRSVYINLRLSALN